MKEYIKTVLDITGRDLEEKKLKLRRENVVWEITEELKADDIRKEILSRGFAILK